MMIVEDVRRAARPALEAILTPDELECTHLDVVTTKDEPVDPSAILKDNLLLRVIVHDEYMRVWIQPTEEAIDFTTRLRSDLQDFVAESEFGWGELRGYCSAKVPCPDCEDRQSKQKVTP